MIVNKVTDLIGNTPLFEIKMKNNDWNRSVFMGNQNRDWSSK